MNSAKVGILKQADEVGLSSLLQGEDGRALEAQIRLEVLGDFANEALEGKLANQQVGTLLELANLTKGDGSRPVAMRLLDAARDGGRLARGLGGELFAGGLATGGFTGGLLGTSHWV